MTASRILFCLILVGCVHAGSAAPAERVVTLTLPSAAATTGRIAARLTVSPLPRGTKLTVRLTDGQIVGAVQPYGRNAERGGSYTIPIPSEAAAAGKVTLRIELRESSGVQRAPNKEELRRVELISTSGAP
ncbi:MAG TPA: hypothetical protein VGJ81_22130 [Thermoanaerobaculia bacterium]|jgi:hypothetical protein